MLARMIQGQAVDDHSDTITDCDELAYYPITHAETIGGGMVRVQVMRGRYPIMVTIPEGLYALLPTMELTPGDDS